MVSEEKIITPVRIKFSKTGDLMYISHLDLARTMQRIILRAGLDIWYSEGFNPQPKMVFALPLSTGVQSVCELLDIKLNSYMANDEIMERLNNNFPRDMRVLEVYNPEIKFKNIEYAEYTIDLYSPKIDDQTASKIDKLFACECLIDKKTKSGIKNVDIRDFIKEIATQGGENHVKISAVVYANNEKNLNPDLIVTAIKKHLDIMTTEGTEEYYTIMRKRMLDNDLKEFR